MGSREGAKDFIVEELSAIVVDAAFHIHNFGAATFKEGIKHIANNHTSFASSRLRVNPRGK
jgi:hypothetical protein